MGINARRVADGGCKAGKRASRRRLPYVFVYGGVEMPEATHFVGLHVSKMTAICVVDKDGRTSWSSTEWTRTFHWRR
jgi:hypothetical protein